MPSRADVDVLAVANRNIRILVERDLTAFWRTLDMSRPESVRDALLDFLPVLTDQYGDVASTVAADWYLDQRVAAGVTSAFTPVLGDAATVETVQARVRSAAVGLFADNPLDTLNQLVMSVGKYAVGAGRQTLVRSAQRDPWRPRIARVPAGATTCAFCLMLASRGPVYASEAAAGKFDHYHADCDCQTVTVGRGSDLPDGYNPDVLYEQYKDARRAATDSDLNALQELRRSGDPQITDAVHAH